MWPSLQVSPSQYHLWCLFSSSFALVYVFVVRAGDLNMRDQEAKAAVQAVREQGGNPTFDLNDAYFHLGKPKELRLALEQLA